MWRQRHTGGGHVVLSKVGCKPADQAMPGSPAAARARKRQGHLALDVTATQWAVGMAALGGEGFRQPSLHEDPTARLHGTWTTANLYFRCCDWSIFVQEKRLPPDVSGFGRYRLVLPGLPVSRHETSQADFVPSWPGISPSNFSFVGNWETMI